MSPYERGFAIDSFGARTARVFDLNEAIRTVTQTRFDDLRSGDVSLCMDLASDLPRTAADSQRVQSVLSCLFAVAQKNVDESGSFDRAVHVRSEVYAGRVQCSITFATRPDGALALTSAACETAGGNPDLTICAGIIQDEGGEFYAWRPRVRAQMTMIVDLPF